MRLGVLCSGGKDSMYACGRAIDEEEVACLISVRSRNEESYMFHTPNVHLVPLQAEAAELPLVSVETEGLEEAELSDLAGAIRLAVERHGIEGVVTGALLSVYQSTRIQRICRDQDLWCFNPLWHADQEDYMERLIDSGFHAIISGVFSAPFDATWLGRRIDRQALAELKLFSEKYGITLTGEGGEYETFVVDAPFFKKRIVIGKSGAGYCNFRGIFRVENARLEEK